MSATAAAVPQALPTATEPLACLGRIAQHAVPPARMPSLGLQLGSAIAQLANYLAIRGESSLEHYFAQALTLACLEPSRDETTPYHAILLMFHRFDRRDPYLPNILSIPPVAVAENPTMHLINSLRDQWRFQPVYEAIRHLDRYGAVARTMRKAERLILASREIAGRSLLAPPTPSEAEYLRLATD